MIRNDAVVHNVAVVDRPLIGQLSDQTTARRTTTKTRAVSGSSFNDAAATLLMLPQSSSSSSSAPELSQLPTCGAHSQGSSTTTTTTTINRLQQQSSLPRSKRILVLSNFVLYSVLFSANHSAGLACLSLASTRFLSTTSTTLNTTNATTANNTANAVSASWHTGILYGTYTGSAVTGLTVAAVQQWGSHRATVMGMALFTAYIASFATFSAAAIQSTAAAAAAAGGGGGTESSTSSSAWVTVHVLLVYIGAALGGMGAGVAWTAQGVYLQAAAASASAALNQGPFSLAPLSTVTLRATERDQLLHSPTMPGTTTTTERDQLLQYPTMPGTTTTTMHNVLAGAAPTPTPTVNSNPPSAPSPSFASTSTLAAIFAFCILLGETLLDVMATVLVRVFHFHWSIVFMVYLLIAIVSTVAMHVTVVDYTSWTTSNSTNSSTRVTMSMWDQVSATVGLLIVDPKMKYMIGFTTTFGLAGAFLNGFVSGQVVPKALNDPNGSNVGLLVAIHGIVAALGSVVFGRLSQSTMPSSSATSHSRDKRKEGILIVGAVAFGLVALPFLLQPNLVDWTWGGLIVVYSLEGIGRASFEGTLKALFADYFANHLEAAFANIILQYGLASAAAYAMSGQFQCYNTRSRYCVEYRDESRHDLLSFAGLVVGASVVAILGILRASQLDTMSNCHRSSTGKESAHASLQRNMRENIELTSLQFDRAID
jgi:hypothetical protein